MKKIILVIATVVYLSGCASSAKIENMAVYYPSNSMFDENLNRFFAIHSVKGGKKTNVMHGGSQVDAINFRQALQITLSELSLLNTTGDNTYSIDVQILEQSMPALSISTDAVANIRYVVKNIQESSTSIDQTIETIGHVDFSEQPIALRRGRIAKERAVKQNIIQFIDLLKTTLDTH